MAEEEAPPPPLDNSDHGEATHGFHAYDSTLRVPFFLHYPDGWRHPQEMLGGVYNPLEPDIWARVARTLESDQRLAGRQRV